MSFGTFSNGQFEEILRQFGKLALYRKI